MRYLPLSVPKLFDTILPKVLIPLFYPPTIILITIPTAEYLILSPSPYLSAKYLTLSLSLPLSLFIPPYLPTSQLNI